MMAKVRAQLERRAERKKAKAEAARVEKKIKKKTSIPPSMTSLTIEVVVDDDELLEEWLATADGGFTLVAAARSAS